MSARPGTVYLVGAGPGDPGLITARGLELLQTCDVLLYDRLVSPQLLAEAPRAERVFVGKAAGEKHSRQVVSDALMVTRARENKSVVRLKGGDPFVFGRGAEEALLLRDSSIPFEIVPGVSSAIAAAAYAGIPVTHRGLASSFVVVTAREEGAHEPDVAAMTVGAETVVLLMGVSALATTTRRLIDAGRDPEEPAAVIEWGTTGRQRVVVGQLETIAKRAADQGISPPATTIIGPVVTLRESLTWFEQRPLFGRSVLVTRERRADDQLTELLTQWGAEVINLPVIATEAASEPSALERAVKELTSYEWIVFTSANAVKYLFAALEEAGLDARAFGSCKVGTVGPATATTLRSRGVVPDLVPESATARSLVEAMPPGNGAVLWPRAEVAPGESVEALRATGRQVEEVPAYRTVRVEPPPAELEHVRAGEYDAVTFTSASAVEAFAALVGTPAAEERFVVCIGPETAAAVERLGLPIRVVADPHTSEGLAAAVLQALTA